MSLILPMQIAEFEERRLAARRKWQAESQEKLPPSQNKPSHESKENVPSGESPTSSAQETARKHLSLEMKVSVCGLAAANSFGPVQNLCMLLDACQLLYWQVCSCATFATVYGM